MENETKNNGKFPSQFGGSPNGACGPKEEALQGPFIASLFASFLSASLVLWSFFKSNSGPCSFLYVTIRKLEVEPNVNKGGGTFYQSSCNYSRSTELLYVS